MTQDLLLSKLSKKGCHF